MMFFAGAILNRADAITLGTSTGLRAVIEELDITELAHCRRFWHRHWHVGYGCWRRRCGCRPTASSDRRTAFASLRCAPASVVIADATSLVEDACRKFPVGPKN
jgi:hypothetical protein